ncbi:MAG: ABC transporter permease [Chloroflexota bacterium]
MNIPAQWSKVIADIWRYKARTILVILSIAVGVFAVGMTINAGQIIQRDLNTPYRASNPASLTMHLSPFDDPLASAVEGTREVRVAEPRREESAELDRGDGEWMEIGLAALPDFERVRVNRFTLESGQAVPGLRQFLLERMSADLLGLGVGDTITIRLPDDGRTYDLEVAGIVHDMHVMPIAFFEQAAGYVSLDTLGWMGLDTHYDTLYVVTENQDDKAHILEVAGMLRERVIEPAGYQVYSVEPFEGEPGSHWASGMISGVLIILTVMGLMCILLGAGLVINTISALITRQVKQIGIIRSVGGLRRQITAMYLAMVLFFCLVALLIGIPLGLVGAKGLAVAIGGALNFDITQVSLPLSVALFQVGVGLLIPLGAALAPILSGTGIPVYDAIYQDGNITTVNKGAVESVLGAIKGLPSPTVLAVRTTFRRKARLIFTLVTLTLAGATFIGAFSTHRTMSAKIAGMGDYTQLDVELSLPGAANRYTAEREALRVPGVGLAEGWYQTSARFVFPDRSESEEVIATAVPVETATISPHLIAGRWLEAGDTNAIVVNEDLLEKVPGLAVGDTVTLWVGEREREYHVVGVLSAHLTGARFYAPYEFFTKVNDAGNLANVVRVRAAPDRFLSGPEQEALGERLVKRFEDARLGTGTFDTQYDLVVSNMGNFDILLSVLLLMSGLLALVGGLGLAGTMGLNVLERTREIGVLRAVGAANPSVRRVVLFEGIFVGLISWLLAVAGSWPIGLALSNVVASTVLNAPADYLFSLRGMWLWLALVLVIATAASLAPAQRASQLTVREVLAYE